jgi:hypothetical protein
MELRLDRLLSALRRDTAAILQAIDRDPLLLKRESSGLVLANASQELYTPQAEHQLYAKGIVYRRDPFQLVSLPLVKIYNLGERGVELGDLAGLEAEPGTRLRFLRKIDGSLVQAFRHAGRVWLTTRGMIEGARAPAGSADSDTDTRADFDYLGAARRLAGERYPRLFGEEALPEGRTLVFELIHPYARKITDYGGRADLILLACFDRARWAYWTYPEVAELAAAHGLAVVDALSPPGATVAEQIDGLLAALAGTDQEGAVLAFERGGEVVYRVKVKSPDYLRLLRQTGECTYERTVAILDANPQLASWPDLEAYLRGQGSESVPEELLPFYRRHYERFAAYLADCERLRDWAARTCAEVQARLGGREGQPPAAFRKAFAALATAYPCSGLLFTAFDGRLDLPRLRKVVRTPDEARRALTDVGLA